MTKSGSALLIFSHGRLSAVLWLLVAGLMVPNMPLYRGIPFRDSGVFLYIGQQVLSGRIPYRDVWDHKPPVIYYINAWGLFIGKNSLWGVWLLELVALCLAAGLGFIVIKQAFGTMPAFWGSVAWLVSLVFILEGGNFTEEFALPFQFLSLYLFLQAERRGYSWRGYLVGVLSSVTFLLKPTLVGIGLSIVIYLVLTRALSRRWRNLLTDLGTILFGAVGVLFVVGTYFAVQGALYSFGDAVLRYNFAYAASTFASRWKTIFDGLRAMSPSWVSYIVIISWFIGVLHLCSHYTRHRVGDSRRHLIALSLIGLPIEFLLVGISGRSYLHYYIAWMPIFSMLLGLFAYTLMSVSATFLKLAFKTASAPCAAILPVLMMLIISLRPAERLFSQIAALDEHRMQDQVVEYITASTKEGDYVLLWGAEAGINFIAHRQSPTRFVYQYPLYTRGYQNAELVKEFLRDITVNRPELIIDTSPSNEIIPPLDPIRREKWATVSLSSVKYGDAYQPLPEMHSVFEYITSNYRFVGIVGRQQWAVYEYTGKQQGLF